VKALNVEHLNRPEIAPGLPHGSGSTERWQGFDRQACQTAQALSRVRVGSGRTSFVNDGRQRISPFV
jgi:hypothetical protein